MVCSDKLPPPETKGDLILVDQGYYLICERTRATIAACDRVNFLKNQVTLRIVGQPSMLQRAKGPAGRRGVQGADPPAARL